MEFVSSISTISINHHISPQIPFLSPKLSIRTWKNKISPSRLTIPNSRKLPLHPFFNPLTSNRKFQISAHFGRPTNRQNYLRKKLTKQLEQFQQVSPPQNPALEFDRVDACESKLDNSKEASRNVEESTSHDYESVIDDYRETNMNLGYSFGESIMWDKLEGWVEQYKKDSEFWGIGTGPIFAVYQDSEGKVEKVVVNEDEVLKRSRVDPTLDRESEGFAEVNFKISFAKDLAREMESGSNVIPNNSTVAKFLPSGGEFNYAGAIQGIKLNPGLFSRNLKIGVLVLCGLFVSWAVKGLLTVREEKNEYTSTEKAMLRRKMKVRTEKEKLVKGNVEVLQDPIEGKSLSLRRPRLDKEVLVKGLNHELEFVEYPGYQNKEFRDKIEEIKIMARGAREIEKRNSSGSEEEDDQTLNDTLFRDSDDITESESLTGQGDDVEQSNSEANSVSPNGTESLIAEVNDVKLVKSASDLNEQKVNSDGSGFQSSPHENHSGIKVRIIKSAKEAREYLSRKHKNFGTNQEHEIRIDDEVSVSNQDAGMPVSDSEEKNNSEETEENKTSIGLQNEVSGKKNEELSVSKESWIEKNFQEFEPIINKIRAGFKDNYYVAREKANEVLDLKTDGDESELEWMKDEKLREIVFRVRDNELSGRDPFHLMDEQDKRAFFSGLEKKVEQENEKLRNLHEYFHSNIENLDYGADGISLYDPPEKILPRWKVPPAEKSPEFLNNFLEERKALKAESLKNSFFTKKTADKSEEHSSNESTQLIADALDHTIQKKPTTSSKTIIRSSDGSVRAGKRSGKEFWQHTKKWSEGFVESYNAETNQEVKSVMKDMGKDLDRWITEKEIQEAAELMDKIPEKGQKFVKEKLDKVKREMELFGPQAVVSKYREYADEKEEDYLWWLDLPFVLCIELYTVENGEQKMGFYSLEMAADLELDPKQHHVVAFEDSGDCKKLCYIIQARMEMLGNGNAFVVARPPKDAFREAKDNGFNVTVIRKGQLQLNIDQTLEEVEELIEEIGSKIYHDKIMKERSVDINGLMKGVFGTSKPAKRKRSKRKLKKPTKH